MSNTITSITKAAELLGITPALLADKSDLALATELAERNGKSNRGMDSSDYSISCTRQYVFLDFERTRKMTWLEFVKSTRLIFAERSMLQLESTKSASISALSDIETRIHVHLQAAYTNVLEVGRCLIEAKESGLVPHGQWEAWVQRHAHMSDRTAQNLMRAAREVMPGSRLEQLPISKIQEILALPEPQREAMAERAQAEDLTVRQLRDEVARERRRSDQMIEKYNNASEASRRKDSEIAQLRDKVSETQRAYDDWKASMDREHRREIGALKLQLQEAMAAPSGISPEAQEKINELKAELEAAEAMIGRQAELRQQAQQALVDLRNQMDRGDTVVKEDVLTADTVTGAVRTFMGCVGYVPHSPGLALMNAADRQAVAAHVEMIAKWAESTRQAMSSGRIVVVEEA